MASDNPTDVLLLVEDDPVHAELVISYFSRLDYEVVHTVEGVPAADLVKTHHPSVVLLDINLPDVDGLEVARAIRRFSSVPIVFLTARSSEKDVLTGLALGGDDYVTKPYSLRELHARITAIGRRLSPLPTPASHVLQVGPYLLNLDARKATTLRGVSMDLTPKEFDILWLLACHSQTVVSRTRIFDTVWNSSLPSKNSRTLDVHVGNLRKKLPHISITTIHSEGYRLEAAALPVSEHALPAF